MHFSLFSIAIFLQTTFVDQSNDETLPHDMRAYSILVSLADLQHNRVEKGTRVDFVGVFRTKDLDGGDKKAVSVFLKNVLVHGVSGAVFSSDVKSRVITLVLTPKQVETMILAEDVAEIIRVIVHQDSVTGPLIPADSKAPMEPKPIEEKALTIPRMPKFDSDILNSQSDSFALLLEAVSKLDSTALMMERQGDFEEANELRKTSEQMRKLAQRLWELVAQSGVSPADINRAKTGNVH